MHHHRLLIVALLALLPGALAAQSAEFTSIGGYGEAQYLNPSGPDSPGRATIKRFVVYLAHGFSERVTLRSELELEDTKLEGGEPGGEVALEQLYLDYRVSPALTLRGGLILPPLGIINEIHEPPTYNGVERPAFDHDVLPTTWRDIGVGILGALPGTRGVNYRLYLVNGLDAAGFSADEGIREGRQEGRDASFANPSLTGRLEWVRPGLTLGGAFWYGGSAAQHPGLGDGAFDNAVMALAADARYQTGPFAFRGVLANITVSDAGQINDIYGAGVGHRIAGGYLEGAVNLLAAVSAESSQRLWAFGRHERYDTQAEAADGSGGDPTLARRVTTVGLTYLPFYNLALKADYRFRSDEAGTPYPDLLGLGLGFSF